MMEQGSPEWHFARLGRVTSSRIADMLAKTKTGWGASRANYMAALALERMTLRVAPHFQSYEMKRGNEIEPQARAAYAFFREVEVERVGFVPHPRIKMAGASPDGLVGDLGLVEFKCPIPATHFATLQGAAIDGGYYKQMQWQMACTERLWCDFASFHPDMPEPMQLHVRRTARHDPLIREIEDETEVFLAELDRMVVGLVAQYGIVIPAATVEAIAVAMAVAV